MRSRAVGDVERHSKCCASRGVIARAGHLRRVVFDRLLVKQAPRYLDESPLDPAVSCTIPGFLLPGTATFTPQDSSSRTSIVRSRLSIISSHRRSNRAPHPLFNYHRSHTLRLSIYTYLLSPDRESHAAETVSPAPTLQNSTFNQQASG